MSFKFPYFPLHNTICTRITISNQRDNILCCRFQPNDIQFICPEDILIYTYVSGADCEATILHPSTKQIPPGYDIRIIKLTSTLWIPLHLSNQQLFTAPLEVH